MGKYTSILKFKLIYKVLTLLFVVVCANSWGQTIVSDNFENTTTLFSSTGATYYSGNSAAGDRPATTTFVQNGTYAIGVNNGSAVLTSSLINTSGCASPQLTLKLASFSIGSTGNGADASDIVKIEISNNGGGSYVNTLEVDGNGNSYWGYASGTGVASTSYGTPAVFQPAAAGGARTTDGYSTLTITGLPSVSNLVVRITLLNNAAAELWVIDNFILSGTCCTVPTTTITPTSATLCASTSTNISVTSSATSPTYTWQASANGSTGWANVVNGTPTGAVYNNSNTSSLSYTTGTSAATYYFRCLVTESGTCTATSATSSITVNAPVSITGATDKGLCSGGNTTMDITGAAATKQWYVSTDNGGTFNPVTITAVYTAGITTNNLSITNPPVSYNGYQYYCTVGVLGCPTLTSSIGVLTVTQTPSAPPTPTALANPACSGTSLAAMTSTVSGVTWYWQGVSAAGTSTTSPTSSVYNISASGTYYVRARTDGSSCLSSTSSSTVITVNTPPAVTTNPIDKTQCVGTNTTFSVAATGTGISYVWQYNTGSGFVNVPNSAPYSNVTSATMSITNITAGMNGYQYQCIVNGTSPCTAATSTIATLIITASGAPATAASSPQTNAIGCNAFNLSWTNGSGSNRLVVVSIAPVVGSPVNGTSYTANSAFGSGGTIAVGEYVVYKGSGNSVFVTGLSASTTYYYKIFEYNGCSANYLTSGTVPNGNVSTTSCSNPAGVTAVYIDACAGTCNYEGNNELIWGTSGSYGLSVANTGPTLNYNSTSPPTTTYISTYGSYPSNITALNTAVTSCSNTVFVDPNTQGYIPPNSKFLIAHSCMCSPAAYDFGGLCNSGPIYVVFGNDATWPCNGSGGIFGNSGAGVRYFDLDFSAWGISSDPIYNFSPNSLVGGDGAYALFSPAGGATTTYSNTGAGCIVPLIILPIDLVDFYATQDNDKNDLVWKVASEKNVSQYVVEKSEDGVNFKELTRINSKDKEGGLITYQCVDGMPYSEITYYKLSTIENNGKKSQYQIIDVNRENKDWKTVLYQKDDQLTINFKNSVPKNSTLSLFDLSGKLLIEEHIKDSQTVINTHGLEEGIYFVKIASPYKTENFKIVISQ